MINEAAHDKAVSLTSITPFINNSSAAGTRTLSLSFYDQLSTRRYFSDLVTTSYGNNFSDVVTTSYDNGSSNFGQIFKLSSHLVDALSDNYLTNNSSYTNNYMSYLNNNNSYANNNNSYINNSSTFHDVGISTTTINIVTNNITHYNNTANNSNIFIYDNSNTVTTISNSNNSYFNNTLNYNNTFSINTTTNTIDPIFVRIVITALEYKILYSVIGITGFFLNIFVVIILIFAGPKNNSSIHQSSSEFHICCQACVDSLVAIFLLTTSLIEDNHANRYTQGNLFDESLCKMWYTKIVLWAAINASIYSMMVLNLERYIAVIHPIFHKTKFTKSRGYSICILATVWTLGVSYKFFYSIISSGIAENGQCSSFTMYPTLTMQKAIGIFTITLEYFIPLTFLTFIYLRMALTLHNKIQPSAETLPSYAGHAGVAGHAESSAVFTIETSKAEVSNVGRGGYGKSDDQSYGDDDGDGRKGDKDVERNDPTQVQQQLPPNSNLNEIKPKSSMARARNNILKTSMTLSISFVMCYTLNQIYFFMASLMPLNLDTPVYQLSIILVFMNSWFNPIIYCMKYDPFKKKVQLVFKALKKIVKG